MFAKIVEIKRVKSSCDVYDIEVENNHNYFAEGILVHNCKNPTSQQGKALLSIQPKYAIPMSGTFLVNSPLDLYVPLKWAGFEQHSFYQYKQHYCVMGGFNNQEVISYKNLDEIRAILDKVMLRRTKDEVLDLPPKIHTTEYVEMTANQKSGLLFTLA